MAIDQSAKLTPTENLIVELLVARYRLGERLWTFNAEVTRQVYLLSEKGYVTPMSGVTEGTVRAMLTEEAVALYLSYDYVPPIARENPEMVPYFAQVTQKAVALKEKLGLGD